MPGVYLHGFDETTGLPVRCKVTSEGKLIVNAASIVENPPTEDLSTKAPTSEWAFDHNADASRHHARYTNAEARAAIDDIYDADGKATKTIDYDRHDFIGVENINMSGQQDGSAVGGGFYKGSAVSWRFWGKKADGNLGNCRWYIYNGGAYREVITTRNFITTLDVHTQNPPVEDDSRSAPTSEWAFDHNANVSAHHAKYTDKEAVDAFYNRVTTLTTGTYTNTDMSAKSMILLDTSGGAITLQGFSGGYNGQVVLCFGIDNSNAINVNHFNAGAAYGDRFLCASGGDELIGAGNYGGFLLCYLSNNWRLLTSLV